jgi:hypothetical protein
MQYFDPDLVDVIISGVPISGFGPDTICKFKEDGKRFKIVKGVKGDVTRSKILAKVGTLTIVTMSTSKSNDVLSLLHQTDISTPGGAGVVAALIRDRNGTSLLAAPIAFVETMPEISYTGEAHPVEWEIMLIDFKNYLGGT